jgi:hypothetical protein
MDDHLTSSYRDVAAPLVIIAIGAVLMIALLAILT